MTNQMVAQLNKELAYCEIKQRKLTNGKVEIIVLHIDALADASAISQFVVHPLLKAHPSDLINVGSLMSKAIFSIDSKIISDIAKAREQLLAGNTLVFVGLSDDCVMLDTKNSVGRSVTESPTSGVTKGPREGFVENIKTNLALIRRKVKTADFKIKMLNVGRYTNTMVAVCFIDSIADKKIVRNIIKKIAKIDIDGVLDSSYISRFIDEKSKFFKTIGSTEKPDVVVGKMLEGRVAIIVDGSPIVLTVPYLFVEDLQSPEDYYETFEAASVARIMRLISVVMAVMLPGIYVSLQLHNYQIIPSKFLITIINATQGIPFNALLELIIVLVLYDILREANNRMPRFAGLSLSVVGAIVLGDAAVRAGLLSAPAVMIGALSGIGLYAMPDNTLILSILRMAMTIVGGVMGMFGIVLGVMFIVAYLTSMSAYKTPYMAPFAPIVRKDLKDALILKPFSKLINRPDSIPNINSVRRGEDETNAD